MFYTNETGRSMVEMLGVLAIIGVLSVGGIMGYTTAMRKYRANEIAQAVTTTAMLAKSANGGEGIKVKDDGKPYSYKELTGATTLPAGIYVNPDGNVMDEYGMMAFVNTNTDEYIRILVNTEDQNLCNAVVSIIGMDNTKLMYVDANPCGAITEWVHYSGLTVLVKK